MALASARKWYGWCSVSRFDGALGVLLGLPLSYAADAPSPHTPGIGAQTRGSSRGVLILASVALVAGVLRPPASRVDPLVALRSDEVA